MRLEKDPRSTAQDWHPPRPLITQQGNDSKMGKSHRYQRPRQGQHTNLDTHGEGPETLGHRESSGGHRNSVQGPHVAAGGEQHTSAGPPTSDRGTLTAAQRFLENFILQVLYTAFLVFFSFKAFF